MSKFQMGYDVSTGEIIRADYFTEKAKLPEIPLSKSARRRLRKKQRNQQATEEMNTKPMLSPHPKSWNWSGMTDYILLIRHWIDKLKINPTDTLLPHRIESNVVAYLTLLFSMKTAREDDSDLVWVDRLEDVLTSTDISKPFLSYIKTYRAGWSG
jgi:hypothetical protein